MAESESQKLCPQCGYALVKPEMEASYETLPNVILHDSDTLCVNRYCNYTQDLAYDRYLVRLAVLCEIVNKPLLLSIEELHFVCGMLIICAGHEEALAQFLGFENFYCLQQHKIWFKELIYLKDEKSIDPDLDYSIMPFLREVRDLVSLKLGFKKYQAFKKAIDEIERVGKNLDKRVRVLIKKIDVPSYPKAEGRIEGEKYIYHLFY